MKANIRGDKMVVTKAIKDTIEKKLERKYFEIKNSPNTEDG